MQENPQVLYCSSLMNEYSEQNVYAALVHTEKSLFKVYLGTRINQETFLIRGSFGNKMTISNYKKFLQFFKWARIMVLWDVMLCCLVSGPWHYEGIYCSHLKGFEVHEEGSQEPPTQQCSVTSWKSRILNHISVNTSKFTKNEHFKHTNFPDFSLTSICSAVTHSCNVFVHLQDASLIKPLSEISSKKLLLMCTIHAYSPALCMRACTNSSLCWMTFLTDTVTFTSHHFVSFTICLTLNLRPIYLQLHFTGLLK